MAQNKMADLEEPISLIIGDKAWSSWSLRPWLALKAAGLPFTEVMIRLNQPDTQQRILDHNPAGKVPVLRHGSLLVWESLAIAEYIAELAPKAGLWPDDLRQRAKARSVSHEMHAGFADLRRNLPMDIPSSHPGLRHVAVARHDIDRVIAIWEDCRRSNPAGGPFLFGRFSIADCMYAPVVTRFRTYAVDLPPHSASYVAAMHDLPAMREWRTSALEEVSPRDQPGNVKR